MNNELTVTERLSRRKMSFGYGTTLIEVYKAFAPELKSPPMNAKVNNITRQLDMRLFRDCTVEFVDYTVDSGMRTYVRTLTLILCKAAQDIALPGRGKVVFEHAISNGFYCVWGHLDTPPSPAEVARLKARMQEIIDADLVIDTIRMSNEDALNLLESQGSVSSAEFIAQQGKCYVDCLDLGGYKDFIYGSVLPRTGYIWDFDLLPYEEGLLLLAPDRQDIHSLPKKIDQPKAFQAFKYHLDLLKVLNVENVTPMNALIRSGRAGELISVAEAMQEKQIAAIAQEIARRHAEGVRIILISGPSSSGKTTFAKRLTTQLLTNLIKPQSLSLDDYFLDREETPRDEHGEYDFESLYALDLPYLQDELKAIVEGKEVQLPTFDFVSGSRQFKGNTLQIADDGILIIEGIHGLNPELIRNIPPEAIFRVYVSALTTLSMDEHNWISTSDNRLLRRIVRDSKYRGAPATKSINMWANVRRGEHKWIFPYQENADVIFNSAMLYELSALRVQAEPLLRQVREIDPTYSEAHRLLKFLQFFEPIPCHLMPPTSLLREFLGGSSYNY